jgi:hypothetical protein
MDTPPPQDARPVRRSTQAAIPGRPRPAGSVRADARCPPSHSGVSARVRPDASKQPPLVRRCARRSWRRDQRRRRQQRGDAGTLTPLVALRAAPRAAHALACAMAGHPRWSAGAAAPLPGGHRRATGGTPDPWTEGPPGPCPGARWSARRPPAAPGPSRTVLGRRPRTNDLAAGRLRAGWYAPPGGGIGRTRTGAGSRPRRGRSRPPDTPFPDVHPAASVGWPPTAGVRPGVRSQSSRPT